MDLRGNAQFYSTIEAAVNTMDNNEDTFETRSVCSSTSRVSQRSSVSAIAARARAKAEAARAQASFAQREADMIKAQAYIEEEQQKAAAEAVRKKAELQVSLHELRLESAAAAAIAEANVLEAAAENEFGELDRVSLKVNIPSISIWRIQNLNLTKIQSHWNPRQHQCTR